jgi:Seryl-tRNA synthetase N-terminal domain
MRSPACHRIGAHTSCSASLITPHSLALRKHMPTKGHSSLITDFRYSAGPMLDLGYVREHMDAIEKMARDRGVTLDLAAFRELDSERRQIITSIERLKAERNKASEEIARLKRKGSSAPNATSTGETETRCWIVGERVGEAGSLRA